jgi:hypothetical protein
MTGITQHDSLLYVVTPRICMVEALFVIAMRSGQQTTATHAKIATGYWLPLWSVGVAHRPGSDSRNHWIGSKRPTRDFVIG